MKLRPAARSTKTFAWGTAIGGLFLASGALAADVGMTLDEANVEVTRIVEALKNGPPVVGKADDHKKKALDLLTRAQGELLKAKAIK